MSLFNGHASKYDKIYIAAALIPLNARYYSGGLNEAIVHQVYLSHKNMSWAVNKWQFEFMVRQTERGRRD